MKTRLTIGVAFLSLVLLSCVADQGNVEQLSNHFNPSNVIKASWSESSTGATSGFVYQLHLHPVDADQTLSDGEEILRTDSIVDTALHWSSENTLQIDCLRGNVYFWTNISLIQAKNIRIELNSACPSDPVDQWTYIEAHTPLKTLSEQLLRDPRIQAVLPVDKATTGDAALRVLHNNSNVKEVVILKHR